MTGTGARISGGRMWPWLALAVGAALAVPPAQDRVQERMQARAPDPDILYFASPDAIKKMALGYEGLLADIYWMRAIQYYGRREESERRPVRYKNLAAMLDITSTLDPDMLDVYRAGSIFLAEPDPVGAGQPEQAVALLDKGIARHPAEWRLRLDKGFIYFWFLKDYRHAGQAWLDGSRLAAAPPWMAGLAAMALSRGGEIETAKMLWRQQLEQSERADIRENARNHLASTEVAETLWTLEFFIEKYKEKAGRPPRQLEDLVRAGFLRRVPVDPSGVPYDYEPASGYVGLAPETKVRYLKVPEEYRASFRRKLEELYGSASGRG
jgi:hypothetical protein